MPLFCIQDGERQLPKRDRKIDDSRNRGDGEAFSTTQ